MKNPWNTSKPPHLEYVEVELDDAIIEVRAVWGDRDQGRLPHWEGQDGTCYSPNSFRRWRYVQRDYQKLMQEAVHNARRVKSLSAPAPTKPWKKEQGP